MTLEFISDSAKAVRAHLQESCPSTKITSVTEIRGSTIVSAVCSSDNPNEVVFHIPCTSLSELIVVGLPEVRQNIDNQKLQERIGLGILRTNGTKRVRVVEVTASEFESSRQTQLFGVKDAGGETSFLYTIDKDGTILPLVTPKLLRKNVEADASSR
jgi:hypothetical protein